MAQAYTPGLLVTPRTRHRVQRVLPIHGKTLVEVGQHVDAQQTVAQALLDGEVTPIALASRLGVSPGDLPRSLRVAVGDAVDAGEMLAISPGFWGWFRTTAYAPVAGTIESVSPITGQMLVRGPAVPLNVRAYLTGNVVEVRPDEGVVIEADAAVIQGIFGVGGESYGTLWMAVKSPAEDLTPQQIDESMSGKIIIGGRRMTYAAVQRAIEVKAAAVVAGGIDDHDLREILGYDLGVAVTGSEKIPLTLMITEGFGEIAMSERTFSLLAEHHGQPASINGTTQIRAGVLRPEIVISLPGRSENASVRAAGGGLLENGVKVRIIRDPYLGVLGHVTAMPSEPRVLETGSKARVVEVTPLTAPTTPLIVPRANVEIVC